MEHPDDEILSQFALDDPLALDAATLVHISDCDRCTHEIEQIQRVVDAALAAGGRSDLRTLVAAPAAVWERVLLDVGGRSTSVPGNGSAVDASPALTSSPAPPVTPPTSAAPQVDDEPVWLFEQPGEFAVESGPGADAEFDRTADPRTLWQIAAAAAVGLVIGAGVAWLIAGNNSEPTVSEDVQTSQLSGVEGHTTSGVISISERGGNAPEITVNLDSLDRGPGFIEAWLLDSRSGGEVALGVLDGTAGTFTVPPGLKLSKYDQVDVSRERFDGDPTHSGVSLARGPVPRR
jgi:hypothetical protein